MKYKFIWQHIPYKNRKKHLAEMFLQTFYLTSKFVCFFLWNVEKHSVSKYLLSAFETVSPFACRSAIFQTAYRRHRLCNRPDKFSYSVYFWFLYAMAITATLPPITHTTIRASIHHIKATLCIMLSDGCSAAFYSLPVSVPWFLS